MRYFGNQLDLTIIFFAAYAHYSVAQPGVEEALSRPPPHT